MTIDFFSYEFGEAGSNNSTKAGPHTIKHSDFISSLDFEYTWHKTQKSDFNKDKFLALKQYNTMFYDLMCNTIEHSRKFCTFGGDHTSAIASIQAAKKLYPELKVLWIDAHMDLHTFNTSASKNMHGMSLATLLGETDCQLGKLVKSRSIDPLDICLFGIRSYEPEEKIRAEKLNLKIIYMDEIKKNGIKDSWLRAINLLQLQSLKPLMLSIDLDAFDPKDAPAVTVPELSGLNAEEFLNILNSTRDLWQKQTIGCEIVEFSPINDIENKTEILIHKLLNSIFT